ncbi:hypothetical protein D3C74_378090 [compost metagenome]
MCFNTFIYSARHHLRLRGCNDFTVVQNRMHQLRTLILFQTQLCIYLHLPAIGLLLYGNIDAVRYDVIATPRFQPHITIDTRPGIPSAVRTLMHNFDQNFVNPVQQRIRNFVLKRRVTILPLPNKLPIHIYG